MCDKESQLEMVHAQLSQKFQGIEHLQLFWSREGDLFSEDNKATYALYLINTEINTEALITEKDFVNVYVSESALTQSYQVVVELSDAGGRRWREMTHAAAYDDHRSIAVVMNGRVIAAPKVQDPVTSDRFTLASLLTEADAVQLKHALILGRLDYQLTLIGQEVVR
jgi:preprotein translocase subunit SecD